MKKIISVIICIILSVGVFTVAPSAANDNVYAVRPASEAPSIDGRAEAIWDAAPWETIEFVSAESDYQISSRFKVLYGEHKLYFIVLVENEKGYIVTNSDATAWTQDSIEIYLDQTYEHFGPRGTEGDSQTRITADGIVGGGTQDMNDFIVAASSRDETNPGSYMLEFSVQVDYAQTVPNTLIGCDIQINNGDRDSVTGGSCTSNINWMRWNATRDANGKTEKPLEDKSVMGTFVLTDADGNYVTDESARETMPPPEVATGDYAVVSIETTKTGNQVKITHDDNKYMHVTFDEGCSDPYASIYGIRGIYIAAEEYPYMAMYMKTNDCYYTTGDIYFATDVNSGVDEAKKVSFSYGETEGNQVVVIDMSANSLYQGTISDLRLDFFSSGTYSDTEYVIMGIAFFKNEADAAAFRVDGVSVTTEIITSDFGDVPTEEPDEEETAGTQTSAVTTVAPATTSETNTGDDDSSNTLTIVIIIVAVVVAAVVVTVIVLIKKKKK